MNTFELMDIIRLQFVNSSNCFKLQTIWNIKNQSIQGFLAPIAAGKPYIHKDTELDVFLIGFITISNKLIEGTL